MRQNKEKRQVAIKQVIADQDIQRQEDLVAALNERGWQVTQATVSRDITELQLIKVPQATGGFKYALFDDNNSLNQLKVILNEDDTIYTTQDNLVYIKVTPGSGPALKSAIELIDFPEVFGAISDDDTVLVILKNGVNGVDFIEKAR